MRLNLDTYAERATTQHDWVQPLSRLDRTLGSASLQIALPHPGDRLKPSGATAGILEFAAAVALGDPPVVSGSRSFSSATIPPTVTLSEDWAAAALVALFADDPTHVDLKGQFRWRSGAEVLAGTGWHFSQPFTVRVPNTIIPNVLLPGGVSVGAHLYLPAVTDYTGGTSADLDAIATAGLPLATVVRIITENGESAWKLTAGTAASDAAAGIVRPTDYHASTNARNWLRVAGI